MVVTGLMTCESSHMNGWIVDAVVQSLHTHTHAHAHTHTHTHTHTPHHT
jgi:hypothetical protein